LGRALMASRMSFRVSSLVKLSLVACVTFTGTLDYHTDCASSVLDARASEE
jgi:hypothetical protein